MADENGLTQAKLITGCDLGRPGARSDAWPAEAENPAAFRPSGFTLSRARGGPSRRRQSWEEYSQV